MSNFKEFRDAIRVHWYTMTENVNTLFETNVDKDELWNLYLDSFPAGSNPISWWTTNPDGMVISIAYLKDDLLREGIDRLRKNAENRHHVRLLRMRHMTIPPSEFDKLVNSSKMQSA